MTTISIDLGGSRLKSALIRDGEILENAIEPIDTTAGFPEQLRMLEREIGRLRAIEEPHGIGMAFPGLVNPAACRVTSANGKYEDAVAFDFRKWADEKFQLPILLENDANAALCGELRYGCGKGCDNAVLMILGTGIGTAAMMEGRLVRGRHFQAGCLGGHISVETLSKGRPCTCGSKGCAETVGGTWGLNLAARRDPDFGSSGLAGEAIIDYRVLAKWERAGDALAHRLMEDSIDAWSTCAVNLIHAYDPDLIILSGGVLHLGERLTVPVAENITRYAWTPWGTVKLCPARLPEYSVVMGLHGLFLEDRIH